MPLTWKSARSWSYHERILESPPRVTGQGPWDTVGRVQGSPGLRPSWASRAHLTLGSTIHLPHSTLHVCFPMLGNPDFTFQREDAVRHYPNFWDKCTEVEFSPRLSEASLTKQGFFSFWVSGTSMVATPLTQTLTLSIGCYQFGLLSPGLRVVTQSTLS